MSDEDAMDADWDTDSADNATHLSDTTPLEVVPEMQDDAEVLMSTDEGPPAAEATPILKAPQVVVPPVPSFKDKLLSKEVIVHDDEEDIKLEKVAIGIVDGIPLIFFSAQILEVLNKKMGFVVVIKLLGRTIRRRMLSSNFKTKWTFKKSFLVDRG